jgi:putative salt-induced outer membrane protein
MTFRNTARLLALACLAGPAWAEPAPETPQGWTGTGELGFALSRGNARSESLNTKLAFSREDAQWKHRAHAAALRARSEVRGDFDGDGVEDARYELSANRFELGGSSGYKFDPRHYLVGSARYEHDDFSSYEDQATVSLNYGRTVIDSERTSLSGEIGPGVRRVRSRETGETVGGGILRARLDFSHQLSGNTRLVNSLLVESGDENTFAQNDLGIAVAMNEALALKAGLQTRHNTEVDAAAGVKNTDTLTTLNLVYSFL